jgi:hypothetical protein
MDPIEDLSETRVTMLSQLSVGDKVMVRMGHLGWQKGTVTELRYGTPFVVVTMENITPNVCLFKHYQCLHA